MKFLQQTTYHNDGNYSGKRRSPSVNNNCKYLGQNWSPSILITNDNHNPGKYVCIINGKRYTGNNINVNGVHVSMNNINVNYGGNYYNYNYNDNDPIMESEMKVKEKRKVNSFNSIQVNCPIKVFLYQGEEEKVKIEADESIIHCIDTIVQNKVLYISMNCNHSVCINKLPIAYITLRKLREIHIHGSSKISGKSHFQVDKLLLEIHGSSSLKMDFTGENVYMQISGSSEIKLKGSVINTKAVISGVSKLRAYGLETNQSDIIISGNSSAHVKVKDKLGYDVSGLSEIKYKLNPRIYRNNCSFPSSVKRKK